MTSAANGVGGTEKQSAGGNSAGGDAEKRSRVGGRWEEGRNTSLVPGVGCGPMLKSSRLPFPTHCQYFFMARVNRGAIVRLPRLAYDA
jgi:hypothetical protein